MVDDGDWFQFGSTGDERCEVRAPASVGLMCVLTTVDPLEVWGPISSVPGNFRPLNCIQRIKPENPFAQKNIGFRYIEFCLL